jgi:hypothetical protein
MLVNLGWVDLNKDNMLVNLSWVDVSEDNIYVSQFRLSQPKY